MAQPLLQLFAYKHLPAHLQARSKPFHDLAHLLVRTSPVNEETSMALRKLLESKDCAVRSILLPDANGHELLLDLVIPGSGLFTNVIDGATAWTVVRVTGEVQNTGWRFTQVDVPLEVDEQGYNLMRHAPLAWDDAEAKYVRQPPGEAERMPCLLPAYSTWGIKGPPGAKIQLWGTKTTAVPVE
jgi:hypothetical protein